MSREPSSSSMQASQVLGGWKNAAVRQPEPSAPEPTPAPQKRRKFRVVVEPAKEKPKRSPSQHADERANYQRTLTKLTTTTEALTTEERAVVRGLRLSKGGPEAEATRRQIEEEVRRR